MVACKGNEDAATEFVASQSEDTTADDVKAAYETVSGLIPGMTQEQAVQTVATSQKMTTNEVNYAYQMGSPAGQEKGKSDLETAKAAYEAVKELEDGYDYDKAIATVAAATGNDKETIELGYENGDPASQRAIQDQLDAYEEGQRKLAEAEVQLAEAPAKLADAEQQLADGKAQLEQYEDGVAQVKDGLQQAYDTEPDPGLESVSDKLGAGFTFLDANGDIDFENGFAVVDAAWEYKADDGAAITTELYTRVGSAIAAMLASVLALAAAALGFAKKYKGGLITAAIAAVAAVGAAGAAGKAGMYFSIIAGSTMGSTALIAFGVLAAAAIANAVSDGAAAKGV